MTAPARQQPHWFWDTSMGPLLCLLAPVLLVLIVAALTGFLYSGYATHKLLSPRIPRGGRTGG